MTIVLGHFEDAVMDYPCQSIRQCQSIRRIDNYSTIDFKIYLSSLNHSILTQVTKADFVQHLKSCNTNLLKQFTNVAPESDEKWNNLANTAFKIFDMNGDGFVDKKEFKRMTNSKKINQRVIDILFEVLQRNKKSFHL